MFIMRKSVKKVVIGIKVNAVTSYEAGKARP
jgi:hypothetical protein